MSGKKTLVLVHGFLSGRDYWHKQSSLKNYADIITVELPGYGYLADQEVSDSIESFALVVIDQINQKTETSFDLLGHSMGGMIAQQIVRLIPERVDKLVLFGTGPIGDIPKRFEPIDKSLLKADKDSYKSGMANAVASWFMNYDKHEDYKDAVELANLTSFDAYCGGLKAMQKWNGVDQLKHIEQQTLILWGDKDRTYDISQQQLLNDNISNSNIITIKNSAHNTHLEKPEEFNKIVTSFLYGDL